MYNENQLKYFKIHKRSKRAKKTKTDDTFEGIYMRDAMKALIQSQNPNFLKKHKRIEANSIIMLNTS